MHISFDKIILPHLSIIVNFILGIIISCLESFMLYIYFSNSFKFFFLISGHFLIIILLAIYNYLLFYKAKDIRLSILLLLSVSFLGPLGGILTSCTSLFCFRKIFNKETIDDWINTLFPEESMPQSDKLYRNILYGKEVLGKTTAVEPFSDIMDYGNTRQKQKVLGTIAKNFRSALAPVLVKALDDEENVIRVQAAAILTNIEDNINKGLESIENLIKKEKEIPSIYLLEKLKNFYFDLLNTGLLELGRLSGIERKIFDIYTEISDKITEENKDYFFLAHLYFTNSNYEESLKFLNKYRKRKNKTSAEFYHLYLKNLFNLKEFSQMYEFIKSNEKELKSIVNQEGNNYSESIKFFLKYS